MPIYCDESGGVGRGVMTMAAISIDTETADAVVARYCEVTGLSGELKGSRIDLPERALLFEMLAQRNWSATVGIAISALIPGAGEDRGTHDTEIYTSLLNDVVSSVMGNAHSAQVIIDDGRYGPETLALIRRDLAQFMGSSGTAMLGLSHRHAGLQIADVIANTFFNRAMVTDRQARMAAIVAPFLESGKIKLQLLTSDTERDDKHGKQNKGSHREA